MLIFYAAYETIKEGTNPLLGEIPEDELVDNLKTIANKSCGMDAHLHHVHVHRYGQHVELTMHIKLPEQTTLKDAHQIADDIEVEISNKLNIEATIHMEPI